MNNLMQGDPALVLSADGATLDFKGGQPVMDQGLENQALISLFTAPDWAGNYLLGPDQQIGSNFEELARVPSTLSTLTQLEKSAEAALDAPIFGNVQAVASNPKSWHKNIDILISPPTGDPKALLLTSNGQNWINQATGTGD